MEPGSSDKNEKSAPQRFRRLRRRAEFQAAARGTRKSRVAFTLQAAPLDAAAASTGPGVGFTVTRKVGGAVVRNRIRRRLKEALRAAFPLETEDNRDYVLVARREALTRDFAALVVDLRQAFRSIAADTKTIRRPPDDSSRQAKD